MTTLSRLFQHRSLPAPIVVQVLLTAALGGIWALLPASSAIGWLALLLSLVCVGVPHGSNDLQLLALMRPRWSAVQRFCIYGGVVAIGISLMLLFPFLGMSAFLVLTAFHFGQGELSANGHADIPTSPTAPADTPAKARLRLALGFGYGAVLLGSLLAPNVQALGAYLPATPEFHAGMAYLTYLPASALPYIAVAAALLGVAVAAELLPSADVPARLVSLLILRLLFAHTDLLFAFAVYFGIWHSPDSIALFSRQLFPGAVDHKVRRFYSAALPITLLAFCLGGALWWLNSRAAFQYPLSFVILTFLFGVTVPHVFVTDPIYRAASGAGES